ncbi:hypothetical protein CC86DRAFT_1864 [Ophiobolus disseminans]|uniref:Uncharacterized protein n=1 Tax=Ophiobolus disseminans TaxID=1469910 RepID=A0A6A7AHY0_9PLEO|nr:hypothetical protein CC86DRAFT_1864 [Ophiobolus disseminans]
MYRTERLGTAISSHALSRGIRIIHRRLCCLRVARRPMLPLARFHGCRLASHVPRPATSHAPNASPIPTSRPGSAAATPCTCICSMITGSTGQVPKLERSRIGQENQCVGGISQSAQHATSSASVLRI